jgi:uncharacterized protein
MDWARQEQDQQMIALLSGTPLAETVPATLPSPAAPRPARSGFTAAHGPLIKAVVDHDIKAVEKAIAAGADVNAASTTGDRQPPILYAVSFLTDDTALPIVTLLVDKGADVNARRYLERYTPLITCARFKKYKTAAYLISHGADLSLADRRGKTALDYAQEKGDTEMISILQTTGATK